MQIDYKTLLENFLSYYTKEDVKVVEYPGRIVFMGGIYASNPQRNGISDVLTFNRFVYKTNGTLNDNCKKILQNIINEAISDGFNYYTIGNEYGSERHQLLFESIEDIQYKDILTADIKIEFIKNHIIDA